MSFFSLKNSLAGGVLVSAVTFITTGDPLLALGIGAGSATTIKILPAIGKGLSVCFGGVGRFMSRSEKVNNVARRANPHNPNSNVGPLAVAGAGTAYYLGTHFGLEGTQLGYVTATGATVGIIGGTVLQDDEIAECGKKSKDSCGDLLINWGRRLKGSKGKSPLGEHQLHPIDDVIDAVGLQAKEPGSDATEDESKGVHKSPRNKQ